MGYRAPRNMFDEVTYNTKTTTELREAMSRKVVALGESVTRRGERMLKLRETYQIDAERLAELILRFKDEGARATSYDNQGNPDAPIVPAGVIANIVREREMIDGERDQIRKMELILRNIKDTEPYINEQTGEYGERPCIHVLSDDELEYLGF